MPRPTRVARRGQRLSLAERYYERGLAHLERGKLDLALADLDEAILLEPKRGEYYVTRGLILLRNNALDEAEDDFAAGLSLDRRQWLAHYGRGMRAFQSGQYTEAIDHFSRAQHIAVNRPEVYMHRAVAFFMLDNAAEAIKDMEFALTLLDPGDTKQRKQANDWLAIFRR